MIATEPRGQTLPGEPALAERQCQLALVPRPAHGVRVSRDGDKTGARRRAEGLADLHGAFADGDRCVDGGSGNDGPGAGGFPHTVIKRLLAVVLLVAGAKLIFTR